MSGPDGSFCTLRCARSASLIALIAAFLSPIAVAWPPPFSPIRAPSSQPLPTHHTNEDSTDRVTVHIGPHRFLLELAADEDARRTGLMKRDRIDDYGGMLFVHPDESQLGYWMKHCRVDIDLIYLDGRGRIVDAHRLKAEPPQRSGESDLAYESRLKNYPSRRPAQFVIELQAGWLDRINPQIGDVIELDLQRLKRLARENERR